MSISPLFFTKTVTLQRPTVTKDAAGGAVRNWTAVIDAVDILGAVQPLSTHDMLLYAGRNIQVSIVVYTETPLTFIRGDRLLISDGKYYSIMGEINFGSSNRVYKYVCNELLA